MTNFYVDNTRPFLVMVSQLFNIYIDSSVSDPNDPCYRKVLGLEDTVCEFSIHVWYQ